MCQLYKDRPCNACGRVKDTVKSHQDIHDADELYELIMAESAVPGEKPCPGFEAAVRHQANRAAKDRIKALPAEQAVPLMHRHLTREEGDETIIEILKREFSWLSLSRLKALMTGGARA